MLPRTSAVVAVALSVLLPTFASAQTGAIAGVVKDATGAVLPGTAVEASSPALIERVRRSSRTVKASTRSSIGVRARTP